ncbi:ABC transporter ATP-binding protein [Paenibacillus hemerocallicola]|uniref:ABC transporter ATP-binding protein n=1 Tax=Paenibacillus hemerocallicola TaxID=1172614 RepID=A0A5C4T892_9BACL|nr:ABC transporter ATP-binding protein [Paenibacillus hemerocallicola]TNJ65241.1 ABC transporter ATP-binding protein [Paenibacillus hemerocallicola]
MGGPGPMGMGGGPGHGARGMMPKVRPKRLGPTLKRLWGYIGRQRAGLVAVFVLTALSSGLALIGPYLLGRAIDLYIIPRDYDGLVWLCCTLLAVYVLSTAMGWIQAYVMAGVSQRTVREMRRDMFEHLQKLPLRFFDSRTHGELMSRTTNDIENVSNSLNQSLSQLINSVLTIIGSLTLMLGLNVWLTLVSLVTIPLTMFVTGQIAKRTRSHFTAQQRHLGELNGYIEETVTGQKVVKSFHREQKALEEFQSHNEQLRNVGIRAQILSGFMGPVNNVINNFSFALIAAIGGWMAIRDFTTIGVVVSFMNYSRQFTRPINDLANQFNMIQSAIAGAERVFEIMDTGTEYDDGRQSAIDKPIRGEVRFDNVTFSYKEGVPVLKNVTLTAKPGDTIALVGPTGAGKTTIVNLLTRFYDIDQGNVTIDGDDLREWDKNRLRGQLGIVLQDAYLFSDTIRENIRYGRLDATDEQIEAAGRLANADTFIRKLPSGYDTLLSAEGGNLSQGQRQLITIARAILADPAILILDEATSSVDTRTEMHIQEAMKSLMQGRTSFVIAHRLSTIREADQILVINGGEIIERGTHHELLERRGFYYELYTSQFKRVG